jgi:hypothetical protein
VPVAASCLPSPRGTDAAAGVTAIETSRAGVTVSVVEPDTCVAGSEARIVVPPGDTPVATPRGAAAPEIVATASSADDHVTTEVRSSVVPFVYVPVAVNCLGTPTGTDGADGVTASATSCADVTVSVADPDTLDDAEVAVTTAVPAVPVEARPLAPAAYENAATAATEELHVTLSVRSSVVPSAYVPVAVNWAVAPSGMEGAGGVTAIETSAAALTVTVVFPMIDVAGSVAVIETEPGATPRTAPPSDTVATSGSSDVHLTVPVTSRRTPSSN